MVVVVECLHPAIASLDGEAARDALGREEVVPICKEIAVKVISTTKGRSFVAPFSQ